VKILLYNPDNGVTSQFYAAPLDVFLQTITPPGHSKCSCDGKRAGNERARTWLRS